MIGEPQYNDLFISALFPETADCTVLFVTRPYSAPDKFLAWREANGTPDWYAKAFTVGMEEPDVQGWDESDYRFIWESARTDYMIQKNAPLNEEFAR
jgi:hypothetical protein